MIYSSTASDDSYTFSRYVCLWRTQLTLYCFYLTQLTAYSVCMEQAATGSLILHSRLLDVSTQ